MISAISSQCVAPLLFASSMTYCFAMRARSSPCLYSRCPNPMIRCFRASASRTHSAARSGEPISRSICMLAIEDLAYIERMADEVGRLVAGKHPEEVGVVIEVGAWGGRLLSLAEAIAVDNDGGQLGVEPNGHGTIGLCSSLFTLWIEEGERGDGGLHAIHLRGIGGQGSQQGDDL